ncbi:hypothetical protein AUJ62_02175 [Candidatus Pacearchaeota archaeon CG1_02_32_21]|nr:MAG: hypothetical protein AUJ62_02175 [Candidatus Pacearchaeota archaeon CG1_02_32_21]
MKRDIGFNRTSENNSHGNEYSGFYRIGIVGSGNIHGKVQEETPDKIILLPHIVAETYESPNGEVTVYRLEEKTCAEVSRNYITVKQPVSDKFIFHYISKYIEQSGGSGIKNGKKRSSKICQ